MKLKESWKKFKEWFKSIKWKELSLKKLTKKQLAIGAAVIVALFFVLPKLMSGGGAGEYSEVKAEKRDLTTYYSFDGNVEAEESQIITSKSVLAVKKLHVEEGDTVKTGDLLFELDDKSILPSLNQAEASLEIAKINYESTKGSDRELYILQTENALKQASLGYDNALTTYNTAALNLERMTSLYEAGGISKAELEQAQNGCAGAKTALEGAELSLKTAQKNYDLMDANLNKMVRVAEEQMKQAEATYQSLKNQYDDTRVEAEIDGEVTEIFVDENESVTMGTKLMNVINYNTLEVVIKVNEYDLKTVAVGKSANIKLNALDKTINGEVTKISREAVTESGISYFPATVTLESDEDLRVGLSVEVFVENKSAKDAVTVPMQALQHDDENKTFVYVKSGGKAKEKYISVGVNDGLYAEVTEGLSEGDKVLVPKNATYEFKGMMMP